MQDMKPVELKIKDQGHLNLLADIQDLLTEAYLGEFHDFANNKYAAPKMALADKLHKLRMGVIEGRYDNTPQVEAK